MRALAIALALIALPCGPLAAGPPRPLPKPSALQSASLTPDLPLDEIRRINRRIAETRAQESAAEPLSSLQQRAIDAAAAVQAKEAAVNLAEDNLDILEERDKAITQRLKAERRQLSEMLAALQRLEREQPPALAVAPDDATSAVRSAILLSEVVPRLRQKAESLARELEELRNVRDRIIDESASLKTAAVSLRDEQARLDALVAARGRLRPSIGSGESQRLEDLARRAEDLTALVEGIGQQAAAIGPIMTPEGSGVTAAIRPGEGQRVAGVWSAPGGRSQSFDRARGQLRMPAVGKIVEKFGVPNDGGGSTKGIKIGVRPGAQVVAPYDGRVRYAGPLKVYGQVLIVETGDDYLIILAGLSRIDAAAGQWLLAGEPVGRMANAGEDGPSALYVEFRKGRSPIDPMPWLSTNTREG